MTKIPFKAIAVDMDGTFMNDDLTYDHERFRKVLDQIKAHHIHFIVSSGRPLSRLKRDFADYLDEIDMIADNGAILVKDNQIISSHYLTQSTGLDLIKFLETNYPQAQICVSGKDASYYKNSAPNSFKRSMRFYYPNSISINDFTEMPTSERIIKLTLNCSAELADEIEAKFNHNHNERIHCTTSGFDDIDIVPFGINKAQALKYFLRYFKVDPSELIAFGDGLNDKEMLELAGLSYAVANGNPEIIKLAKYTAPSNNESGVLQVLEKYFEN
ncbi:MULTISPECIES: Cof-type HAD-IIB family hydrolase [Lactobacillus]|uniref:HAD family hydrolase n=1 Tax=Lactobacillus xujianguonis TaxID=2495899 RepID=A0A437SW96_9LACO|nr:MULTISPECIES: Cof-type HAD-IIB family hydrolase [Lactobacillus]RVU71183.1 HAD family hydrolase [Lactobacillus xujianguonis]RVU74136.1 HAD family hydrolase [Lactobacillus xujianguonis]